MSHPERGGDATKPVFVDNRDGNTLARAITTHLAAPTMTARLNAQGLGGFASFLASANGLPTRPTVGRTPA